MAWTYFGIPQGSRYIYRICYIWQCVWCGGLGLPLPRGAEGVRDGDRQAGDNAPGLPGW